MTPTEIAKAALCEAGRPDLADRVREAFDGWPAISVLAGWTNPDRDLTIKAFVLAHQPFHPIEVRHEALTGRPYLVFNPRDYNPKEHR